jgi:hypothetical protein
MDSNTPADSHKVGLSGKSGDVDETGEIVDLADVLLRRARQAEGIERLRAAICDDEAAVDVDEHLARVARVVELARSRP